MLSTFIPSLSKIRPFNIDKVIPSKFRIENFVHLNDYLIQLSEDQIRTKLERYKNPKIKSLVGQGFSNVETPSVLTRLFKDPRWYSPYSPYQAEISQGRLESLFNYQTMITEITGLECSNASMLDEASALCDAIRMLSTKKYKKIWVSEKLNPATLAIVKDRFEVETFNDISEIEDKMAIVVYGYPDTYGNLEKIEKSECDYGIICVADLLGLIINEPPNVDIMVGNTQRFGMPLGYGGPHAAYMACKRENLRLMPGRIVMESVTRTGERCYYLGVQTREQHIKREKALSNICTAQALPANVVSLYGVYKGYSGLYNDANRCKFMAFNLAAILKKCGHTVLNKRYFDTLHVRLCGLDVFEAYEKLLNVGIEIRVVGQSEIVIALDISITNDEMNKICKVLVSRGYSFEHGYKSPETRVIMKQDVFNTYNAESQLSRYMEYLVSKDYSLVDGMIPLGSCTMKLNPAFTLEHLVQKNWAFCHPMSKIKMGGYDRLAKELETQLCQLTGFDYVELSPNAGSVGEYIGLLTVYRYYSGKRKICLIPTSAHGTNPASARLAGFTVVSIKCGKDGSIDIFDLDEKIGKYSEEIGCIMITWPSTYGLPDENVMEIIDRIHKIGGQVYMDGANMNAIMGLARQGDIGADLGHLNLHKTLVIPHGGGGPGVGPLGYKKHLAKFVPRNDDDVRRIVPGKYGSGILLPITWSYITMCGLSGLRKCSEVALSNSNYLMESLKSDYKIMFKNRYGMVGHEFIIDLSEWKQYGVTVEDISKRIIDYGFHPPTMSWPVPNCLMIEPTESEDKAEMDRFIRAMKSIREELEKIKDKEWDPVVNPIKMAPHSRKLIMSDSWELPYTRQVAMGDPDKRYWPTIERVNNIYGDKQMKCNH